jgi:hypothetical protein
MNQQNKREIMTRRIFLEFSLAVSMLSDQNMVKDVNIDFTGYRVA